MYKIYFKSYRPLIFSLLFIIIIASVIEVIKQAGYHLTYAVTASIPQGFYLITPLNKINRYDMVEFIPPPSVLAYLQEKHWVPLSGKIIKYVFALPGDYVCYKSNALWLNGKLAGKIHQFYAPKKMLPQVNFCGKLKTDQYLLLSTYSERSFDSRYFGIITRKAMLGRARAILVKK